MNPAYTPTFHNLLTTASQLYKMVGDPMQQQLDELLTEEPELCCPVTLVLLIDPVKAADGYVYERTAADALCTGDGGRFVSPMTREALPANFEVAAEIRELALGFRRERAAAMLAFAEEAAAARAAASRATARILSRSPRFSAAASAAAASAASAAAIDPANSRSISSASSVASSTAALSVVSACHRG